MVDIGAVCALCLTATILCKLIERYHKEFSLFLALVVCCGIVIAALAALSPIIALVDSLFVRAGLAGSDAALLFKALGICYITQFTCDLCRDSGENAMASQAELAGKIALLLLALPLFYQLTELVSRLMAL